jgi:hypothetical protein
MINIVQIFFSRSLYLYSVSSLQYSAKMYEKLFFPCFIKLKFFWKKIIIPPLQQRRGILFYLCPSFRPSKDIFLSNYWWQKSEIWSQTSYRYAILWEAFLDPSSDSDFLFADLVGFYTHWTYMRGYHKWALANSSSCLVWLKTNNNFSFMSHILM